VLELKVLDGEREVVLQFEHSLLSLSKWESKHKKAFLATPMKTSIDMIDYFESMLLTPGEDTDLVYRLDPEQLDQLANYVNTPQTASSVPKNLNRKSNNEIVTSELIYYWMTAMRIPFEAQTWHLSRLMILIEITNFKSQPEKKRRPMEMYSQWREMNARNKERFGTTG
jgi:hypothetical protein